MLLILTTIRRLAVLLLVFLAWTPAAYAWSWPVQGPVVQPFSYDETHPYAAGQHRGVDIGADAAGESVLAPAAGTVSFAGTVASNGKSVTIETADGYSVTLTHLGSIAVAKGVTVAEQDVVGAVGPSGTPEVDGPYVHLGIRVTTDPNGYVDPLGLLPPAADNSPTETTTTASQPASNSSSSTTRATKPARSMPRRPRVASTEPARSSVRSHESVRTQKPRVEARTSRMPNRTAVRDRVREQTSSPQRSGVAPELSRPIDLGAGHKSRPVSSVAPLKREPSSPLVALACNLAAALFGLGAALGARRYSSRAAPIVGSHVLELPLPESTSREVSRAA